MRKMGTLALAQCMADNPSVYCITQLRDALARLEKTRSNGGVRNSERAMLRLDRRLNALAMELGRRTGVNWRAP